MSPFTDILGQELFPGAIVVRPSIEARNHMDYGVIIHVGHFAFTVSSIRSSQTVLPEGVEITPIREDFTSAFDNGFLVIHPELLLRSNVEAPRYWKKILLNESFNALRNIRHPDE